MPYTTSLQAKTALDAAAASLLDIKNTLIAKNAAALASKNAAKTSETNAASSEAQAYAAAYPAGSSTTLWSPKNGDPTAWFPANAYRVPLRNKTQLQSLINTYGVVRLDAGDYASGVGAITLQAGQAIYAPPGEMTRLPSNITIAPGANGATIKGGSGNFGAYITFPPSATPTSNVTISSMIQMGIRSNGASLDRLAVLNMAHHAIDINNTAGGYLRRSRFVRLQAHGGGSNIEGYFEGKPIISIQGKADRSSWGNSIDFVNVLDPWSSQFVISGQADFAINNVDLEQYQAVRDGGPAFKFRNCGRVWITNVQGYIFGQVSLDNGADELFVNGFVLGQQDAGNWIAQASNNVMVWANSGNRKGWMQDLGSGKTRVYSEPSSPALRVNGSTSAPSGAALTALQTMLTSEPAAFANWQPPVLRAVPDPAGPNWAMGRSGKPDSREMLQAIINNNRQLAELPAGVFYISAPLDHYPDQCIAGKGKGATAIIPMNDTFAAFKTAWNRPGPDESTSGLHLIDMTVQGGSAGWMQAEYGNQTTLFNFGHVAFRNQANAGILLQSTYAWDNGWLESVDFVNCATGVKTVGTGSGAQFTTCYMDKVVFYRCQYLNCGRAVHLNNTRVNNSNLWLECYFKGSTTQAMWFQGYSENQGLTNNVFEDNAGAPMIRDGMGMLHSSANRYIGGPLSSGAFLGGDVTSEGDVFIKSAGVPAIIGDEVGAGAITLLGSKSDTKLTLNALTSYQRSYIAINSQLTAAEAALAGVVSASAYGGGSRTTQTGWLPGTPLPGSRIHRERT